jgi:hypothetical protein
LQSSHLRQWTWKVSPVAGKVASVPPILSAALPEDFPEDVWFKDGRKRDNLQVGQSGFAEGDNTCCVAVEVILGLDLNDDIVLVEARRPSAFGDLWLGLTIDKGLTEGSKMVGVTEADVPFSCFRCVVLLAPAGDGMDGRAGSFSIPAFLSLFRSSSTAGLMFWAAGELLMLMRLVRLWPTGWTRRSGMSVTMEGLEDDFVGGGFSKHSSQHGFPLRSTLGEFETSV